MIDGWTDAVRAWLESLRAWLISRDEFSWARDWISSAHVSTLWVIVVAVVVVVVLAIGFWPPLKPDKTSLAETTPAVTPPADTPR